MRIFERKDIPSEPEEEWDFARGGLDLVIFESESLVAESPRTRET